jgi:hypothetical protein
VYFAYFETRKFEKLKGLDRMFYLNLKENGINYSGLITLFFVRYGDPKYQFYTKFWV